MSETAKISPEATHKAYNPADIESKWYAFWEENGFFEASVHEDRNPHTIMMPPPNVTGRLHMGHALQSTIQDILTRMRRMQGFESLWMPGLDHAGIATQNVVEKAIKKEQHKSRHDLGREKFIEHVWEWKNEYGGIIVDQSKKLGVSCDWSRQRFTMDEGFTAAVQKVFVDLYNEGLIYRGNYLVNWCPIDMTALSDEEVDNVERNGSLWYIKYPLVDESGFVTVATTRPETMFGDSAIAVNPDDERYSGLIGKEVRLPLTDRTIPIIADDYVKSDFGAGALKVTPGHDKNDFEIGQRHSLAVISAINPDGTLNENAGEYQGVERFAARDKIVSDLDNSGLLEKVEDYRGTVPVSSRSKAIIEPLISRQWFVKMKPLAEPALEAVRDGSITFHPKRWENEYFRWLDNIRDWTISRQLWWGHRIPVWYHTNADGSIDEERPFIVSVEQPEESMVQDQDVLDTWFSSWLWPFATLGWPERTSSLRYFYPTSVLVSGYDILFFWIARMIMAGLHFTGEIPFKDIFITGMVKDKQGRWMSKSLGNGIDPLDMIDQYGADAVRYSLTILCAQGQDIKLDPTKFEMGRNFANKIWNAFNVFGRFMEDGKSYNRERSDDQLTLVEKWMLHRVNSTIELVNEATERYRLNEALAHVYDVFWRDYCDWYLELIKPEQDEVMDDETIALAVEIFETMLRLLHPFMPYITEELWSRIAVREPHDALIAASWPSVNQSALDEKAASHFELIKDVITGIRNIRAQYSVPPREPISATISFSDEKVGEGFSLSDYDSYFRRLVWIDELTTGIKLQKPPASASSIVGAIEVFVPLEGLIDLGVERERLEKEIEQKEKFLSSLQKKLQNEQFVARAPQEIVDGERAKEKDAIAELNLLKSNLTSLDD